MATNGSHFCNVQIVSVTKLDTSTIPPPYNYGYAYVIRIANTSPRYTFQILSRKWTIKDGDMKDRNVIGDKVVGQVPILGQGKRFTYQSYMVMRSSFGSASGFYYGKFTDDPNSPTSLNKEGQLIIEGDPFYITIPEFKLIGER